jgi:hypothetical protein
MTTDKPFRVWKTDDPELPWRCEMGKLSGAGQAAGGAAAAMLSAGGLIPAGMRGKEAARHVFWHYEAKPPWAEIVRTLEEAP